MLLAICGLCSHSSVCVIAGPALQPMRPSPNSSCSQHPTRQNGWMNSWWWLWEKEASFFFFFFCRLEEVRADAETRKTL